MTIKEIKNQGHHANQAIIMVQTFIHLVKMGFVWN